MKNYRSQFIKTVIVLLCFCPVCVMAQPPWLTGLPVQATWFWDEEIFDTDGYKTFIDLAAVHSPYELISVSVRLPGREITTRAVHDQIKLAAEYAAQRGISMTADLDVRAARREFELRYPDELQEMLLLREVEISSDRPTEAAVHSKKDLTDHYTGATVKYIPLSGKMLRVYSYQRTNDGIDPKSLKDITVSCKVIHASKDSVFVSIPSGKTNTKACVLVSFTHFTPDVFAPHLLEFQRDIIRHYADVPLVGVFKDEWGFPPCFDGSPQKNQFWYSKHIADAYSQRTKGRDLLSDCLLMHLGIKGKERERQMVINHLMEMSWQRNRDIEDDYYHAVKETFGPDAVVTTHPTWYPYPDCREYMKNGLHWWVATRDWAQTDEITPFAVRTALSKKWGSPIWYNMYYATSRDDYEQSLWSCVLGGGRINYHPIYPSSGKERLERDIALFSGDLMSAESKVRLLNYISDSPLNCPVAVIFGHACTMNWAGPAYDDVGMELVEKLWCEGIPVDLIPSSEIHDGHVKIDHDGWICYGQQRYTAVVLYHPEFERSSTASFFQKAAKGRTNLMYQGEWTRDFESGNFNGSRSFPASMKRMDDTGQIIAYIKKTLAGKFEPNTAAERSAEKFLGYYLIAPPTTGHCRLIDGTFIQVAGTKNRGGDIIQSKMNIGNHSVIFDAVGVAAIRLDSEGQVEALAAGGLKSVETGNFTIRLDKRLDIALRKNELGEWEGIIQGCDVDIPPQLLNITQKWTRLKVPTPLVP